MYKMPEEDPEIEFMDLDSENSEAAPRAPRGSQPPSKARRSITIAIIIGAITLCALLLNTVLHQPAPKPAQTVVSSNGPTQLSFIKDGTGYAVAQVGMIFAVRLRDGAVLWHYDIRQSMLASIVDTIGYVISPWMNRRACDDELCRLIGEAIARGVRIRIGYCMGKERDREDATRNQNNVRLVKSALERFIPASATHLLEMQETSGTHEKILVGDSQFAVNSSFNWLSYVGNQDEGY